MPSIDQNRASWDSPKPWARRGEQWSEAWGSTDAMWHGTILPRIAPFLPARHLLEIAPGHGRITAYLLRHCAAYTGIDLAVSAVEQCRTRFADVPHARFEVTDGRSLPGLQDGAVDFAFSWDSLVHVCADVMTAYLAEIARVLAPGGVAFLHHGTLADYVDKGVLTIPNPHWRDPGVSAELIRDEAQRCGLACPTQELVQWGSPHHTDCFTVLRRPVDSSEPAVETRVERHPDMGAESSHFKTIDSLYWRSEAQRDPHSD